jgi:hypothetical protein
MTLAEELTIKDLERVQLKPGDVLVIHVGAWWDKAMFEWAQAEIDKLFPDNRCLIVGPDVSLEIVNDGVPH